jgi:hypothetical protein
MTSKDKVRLGLAAGLLLVAVLLFVLLAPRRGEIPDAGEAKTIWYCAACKNGFELTGVQTAEMVRLRRVQATTQSSPDAAQPRRPGRSAVEVTKCPFCGEWAGVPARRCGACRLIFPARAKDGEIAVCPDCKWDPTTGAKAEGVRARLGEE